MRIALLLEIRIGCTGWSYDGWIGPFYPSSLPQKDYLDRLKKAKKKKGDDYACLPVTGIEKGGSFVYSGLNKFIVHDVKVIEESDGIYYDILSDGRWHRINPRTNMMWRYS